MIIIATVCIGDELTTDVSGKLKIVIEGNPPDLAWPYPCAIGSANGLHRQPGGGMWVAPNVVVSSAFASGSAGGARIVVPVATTTIDTASITIVNPSACFTVQVFRWLAVDVDLFLPPGTDSEAAVLVGGNELFHQTNGAPGTGSEVYTHAELVTVLAPATIPAGGSLTLSTAIQVGDGDGGAEYAQDRWSIRAILIGVPT